MHDNNLPFPKEELSLLFKRKGESRNTTADYNRPRSKTFAMAYQSYAGFRRQPRRQPTHYVYLDIPDQVKSDLRKIQLAMRDDTQNLNLRPIFGNHLTVGVFDLNREMSYYTADDLDSITTNLLENITSQVPEFQIQLGGLGHFDARVVYVRVEESKLLLQLRNAVVTRFEERGLVCTDKRPFNPHITIFKGDFGLYRGFQHKEKLRQCISRVAVPNFQSVPVCKLNWDILRNI
ncbi:uncharacterized protein [Macrobrachium rosenbergii]|uniref:uncharacterized protein n=1 Tax=Macrobrachium rosenbergii TaxID=79674 RepID=UPI0034D65F42